MTQPDPEVQKRRPAEELLCLTPPLQAELKPRLVRDVAADIGSKRSAQARERLEKLSPEDRRRQLRRDWGQLLGNVDVSVDPKVSRRDKQQAGGVTVERLVLEVETGIVVPALLLIPGRKDKGRQPVVVGLAQDGKQGFLRQRPEELAGLLEAGVMVCLPDVRGTGETRPAGELRGPPTGSMAAVARNSACTLLANEELMLGQTLLGARLRDLRSVLRHLRARDDVDGRRIALWGDSFAAVNPDAANLR